MNIKTKKHQLNSRTYTALAMKNILSEWWWVWGVPLAILLVPIFYAPALWWCIGIAFTLSVLYLLFWLIQFTGITQMEQSKFLFQKLSYEINSRQILMKINPREGMPISWGQIKRVKKGKDYFLLFISKVQLIHLPFKIFNSTHEIKFFETILKRKNLL